VNRDESKDCDKTAKIPYQREIWIVEFPKTTESRKPLRPCVVVISNDEQNIYDKEVIVLPLTTEEVISGEIQPFEILVKNNSATGLDEPSRILTNRVHTIDKELRLREKLGKISLETWKKLLSSLWVVITKQEIV
jgi:mRNA-degrading endonuclease toxin of MazEF toxin-antitoxin module